MKKQWKLYSGLGGLALVFAIVAVWLFGGTSVASAAEAPRSLWAAEDLHTLTQSTTGPGLLGDGYLAHGGWGGRGGFMFPGRGSIDYQQLLADALGITVDELQAAFEEARTAAIEQAVEEGLITREQADEMLVWGGLGRKGFGGLRAFGGPMGRGSRGVSDGAIDENALLADALGITIEELDAARETANQAAIDQALEEGLITQEQAEQMRAREEQMQARKDLQSYLDRNTLLAKALGMTVEELQAALAEGKSLSTLMGEKGLDAATVRENLQAAYEATIAQAVTDGVITQEQADQMQSGPGMVPGGRWGGFEFGGPMGRRWAPMGRDGFRGHGGFRSPCPSDTEDTSGARFSRPARVLQGGSAL